MQNLNLGTDIHVLVAHHFPFLSTMSHWAFVYEYIYMCVSGECRYRSKSKPLPLCDEIQMESFNGLLTIMVSRIILSFFQSHALK